MPRKGPLPSTVARAKCGTLNNINAEDKDSLLHKCAVFPCAASGKVCACIVTLSRIMYTVKLLVLVHNGSGGSRSMVQATIDSHNAMSDEN